MQLLWCCGLFPGCCYVVSKVFLSMFYVVARVFYILTHVFMQLLGICDFLSMYF